MVAIQPGTIHCRKCGTPLVAIGEQLGGRTLEASITGWEMSGKRDSQRLRIVMACANCGQRRRVNLEEADR